MTTILEWRYNGIDEKARHVWGRCGKSRKAATRCEDTIKGTTVGLYGLYLPFFSDLQLAVTRYVRIYAPEIEGMIVFEFKSFVKLREKLHTYLFFHFFRAAVNMHWNKLRMVAHRFVSDVLYDGRTYEKRNKTNIQSHYRRTCFGPD
jgi:hypothetical protein